MKKVYFVTTNKGKVASVSNVLSKFDIEVIHEPLEIPEIRSDDVAKIAKHKVLYAYEKLKKPVLALDAGFWINSLNGFPKAYVNFVLETIGIEGMLKLVKGKDNSCQFKHALAFFDNDMKEPKIFEQGVKGKLVDKKIGEKEDHHWSDLFFVFIPDGYKETLAEMGKEKYFKYRDKIYENSYYTDFANWFNNR